MIERGPVIGAVHADIASADFVDGVAGTGENSYDRYFAAVALLRVQDHGAVVGTDACGRSPVAKDDVGASKSSMSRRYFGDKGRGKGEGVKFELACLDAQGLSLWEQMRMEVGVALVP